MDKTVKILVILFVIVGIILFGYHWINQWHNHSLEQSVQEEKNKSLEHIAELEAEIQRLSEDIVTQNPSMLTSSEMTDVFGTIQPEATDCSKITNQVAAFFQYLDSKAYLIWPDTNIRAEELFEEIYTKLAANPPINVGEMENLHSVLRNVTHFYRILGKDRIELLKTILQSESAVMEPAMAVIHAWLVVCSQSQPSEEKTRLKEVYPYAVYFLNTLGGRSYLLRRDSKIRMLVTYYAMLTVDLANDNKLNAYGLDVRPYIDYLFYDINNQKGLMHRERYLTKLAALKDKYQ
jgi:hypothetical protein